MENPVCLTAKDVSEFCATMRGCQDGIAELAKTINRIEASQQEQIRKFEEFKSFARDDAARLNARWGERFDGQNDDNEKRFSALENWRAWITGVLAVVCGIIGIIGTSVWNSYTNYPEQIREAVKAELSAKYNIDIQNYGE
jgi:phage-related minor tail protein